MSNTQENINTKEFGYMSYNKLNMFMTTLLVGFSIGFALFGDRINTGLNGLAGVGIYMGVLVVVVAIAKSILTSESLSINNPFHGTIQFFHTAYGQAKQFLHVNTIIIGAIISIFSVIGILCLMFQWQWVLVIIAILLVIFTIFNILLWLKPGLASLLEQMGSHFKNPPKKSISEQIALYATGLLMILVYLFLMLYATFNNPYGETGTNNEEIERRNSLYMWFSLFLIVIIPYILWLIPLLDFSNGKLKMYINILKICVTIVFLISVFIYQ